MVMACTWEFRVRGTWWCDLILLWSNILPTFDGLIVCRTVWFGGGLWWLWCACSSGQYLRSDCWHGTATTTEPWHSLIEGCNLGKVHFICKQLFFLDGLWCFRLQIRSCYFLAGCAVVVRLLIDSVSEKRLLTHFDLEYHIFVCRLILI